MKKIVVLLLTIFCVASVLAQPEEGNQPIRKIPSVMIKTGEGGNFNTADIDNDGNPIIISFWALWCKPCIRELTTIADVYDEWVEETDVKLIAISIDDARSTAKVMPFVNGKAWDYEVYLDPNSDFKRAMNVNFIPHTFLVDGDGNIVWQHTSFTEGAELELIELVEKVKAGEDISGHE
jgi:thiol-disulfide isomerase/thioredoxin